MPGVMRQLLNAVKLDRLCPLTVSEPSTAAVPGSHDASPAISAAIGCYPITE
jgi:hypothetical protein